MIAGYLLRKPNIRQIMRVLNNLNAEKNLKGKPLGIEDPSCCKKFKKKLNGETLETFESF